MRKCISLMLALTLALALAVPAHADSEDLGVIGGADGPTFIQVSTAPKSAAAVKAQREQVIRSLGGTVGQTNVLLGNRCIAFTDAAPEAKDGRTMVPLRATLEAMGATVGYDKASKAAVVTGDKASFTHVIGSDFITLADGSTVKMDVASYATAANRTMVPVRFFSQVLGYDVFWDNDYKMVFLLDRESFVKALDGRLSVLNGDLDRFAALSDSAKSVWEQAKLSGTVKRSDEKGKRSAELSGSLATLRDGNGTALRLELDLSRALELLSGAELLPQDYRALLGRFKLELCMSEKTYLHSAFYDYLFSGGVSARDDVWYAFEDGDDGTALLRRLNSQTGERSVGGALYAMLEQGDANHFYETWRRTTATARVLESLFGDGVLTRAGKDLCWSFGPDELADLLNALTGRTDLSAQTLKATSGAELSMEWRLTDVRATGDKPVIAPPDGAAVITIPAVR